MSALGSVSSSAALFSFELTPNELWWELFLRLDVRDLLSMSETCRTFNKLINDRPDSEIWRQLCYSWALELQQEQLKEKEAMNRNDFDLDDPNNTTETTVATKSYQTWRLVFIESKTVPSRYLCRDHSRYQWTLNSIVYWNRPIKVMDYSSYNDNYQCLVEHVLFCKEGSLEHCQLISFCQLSIQHRTEGLHRQERG